jgi:hypothetical protein
VNLYIFGWGCTLGFRCISFTEICWFAFLDCFSRHKKQKEEDIAICECKFNGDDPDSACGERCLNLLTSTECTPGYCPCGVYCKNQVTSILHICVISINPNDYCIPVPFGVHMYITCILVKFLFCLCRLHITVINVVCSICSHRFNNFIELGQSNIKRE